MKAVVWFMFALLTVFWTAVAMIAVELVQWSAHHITAQSGHALTLSTANVMLPFWIAPWLDTASWATLLQSSQALLAGLSTSLPLVGSLLGWLTPLIWLTWGVGMAVLLILTVVLAMMVSRLRAAKVKRASAVR